MSSSEDDDEEDDEISRRVDNLMKSYKAEHESSECPEFIAQRLQEEIRTQSHSCMICIERVKKTDAVWNCRTCRTPYHLQCIQRWARESSLRTFSDDDEETNVKKQQLPWYCPKCRFEYQPSEIPTEYRCFCGQVSNPKHDPWLVPHSCGNVCRRSLKCGHFCIILCHPGLCPPCPKMVRSKCFCGKSNPQMKRCYDAKWSCGQKCNRKLLCGLHRCSLICHEGDCQLCTEKFQRKCMCGKKVEERPCSEPAWSCNTICNRTLPCGNHKCPKVCHEGGCGSCADGRLSCPCGKTVYQEGNCIDDLKCCGDTCGKLLDCKIHKCAERCHRGVCSSCNQLRTKRCRCGLKEKEFICGKEFLCDVKCKQKRQCGKHSCNRKCCDGNCPPCEQVCGRSLECGNHKCPQPCHLGPCFPCVLTSEVKCRCSKTVIKVPCGHERKIRPPRCKNLCQIPPVCKHKMREPHRCHFGDCPPCRQICETSLKCGHQCRALCHTGLLIDVNSMKIQKPSTPWEKLKPKFELVDAPCPPCQQQVPITCLGGHETGSFPCFEAKPYSCGRPCGKMLQCGNHKCQTLCHDIEKHTCNPCEERCQLQRPKGCTHACTKFCHPAPCPACRQMVRVSCHCSLNQKFVPCLEWCVANDQQKLELQSCGNQCPKLMPCSHRCNLLCHIGNCSDAKQCQKKVTIKCPCARKSSKAICNKVQSGEFHLDCDEECENQKLIAASVASKQASSSIENEESKGDQQNQLARRRRKNKKRFNEEEVDQKKFYFNKRNVLILGGILVVVLIFIVTLLLTYL